MCSHYQALKDREKFLRHFDVAPPPEGAKLDLWPGYVGPFIRANPLGVAGYETEPLAEALNGLFGIVPHWSTDTKITKSTYNCRSETAAEKPSFRDACKRNQRCIIPADAIYEPDWRSGKTIATRIEHIGGQPMGIAGLWSSWQSPKGEWVFSYTMLTLNADAHPLMNQFHKPTDEKRMVAILPVAQYKDWLRCKASIAEFMRPYPAENLLAVAPPAPNSLFT